MKKRSIRWGCFLGILLVLFLVVGGGGLLLVRSSPPAFEEPLDSSIIVFITSPASGEEVSAGDYVSVSAQAVAPDSIAGIELFVDGKPFGSANPPDTAAWTWQAFTPGVHTFTARATNAKGETGNSQTVIVNVLAGNGVIQVFAGENQTPNEIGSGYGASPEEIQKTNPQLDPNAPLPDGQPVKIPVGQGAPDGGSAPGGGQGAGLEFIPVYISWTFTPLQPVDDSYCYTSAGNGIWEKMPKPPFSFLDDINPYAQFDVIFPNQTGVIQAQCWGWLAGALKFLGQGEAKFDVLNPSAEVTISGEGFVLKGLPKLPPIKEDKFLGVNSVPPPYALREPSNAADCLAHGDPIVAGFLCPGIMNAKVKQNIILEWEWKPEACWPGFCQYGATEIAGYGVYEIDPATQAKKFLADVHPSAMRVAFLPLPWGAKCYGVEAYIDYPGMGVSEMATYCPGQPPTAKKVTIAPAAQWLTTGGQWIQDGDCDDYGGAETYKYKNQNNGFGNQNGQVLVGSYIVDDDDCYREGHYSAGVKFDISLSLPPNAVVQNADLRFSTVFMNYGATGIAAPKPASCISAIGKAKKDWSGLSAGIHFASSPSLTSLTYNTPLTSMSNYMNQASVTQAVVDWIKDPSSNHGFILAPAAAPHPYDDGSGSCLSGLGNFQLDIYYFAP